MGYETVGQLSEIVVKSMENAEKQQSKIIPEVATMRGMSSPKIRHLLNNLCSYGPCNYLEIGTYGGSTFVPALYKNDVIGMAIDNWSQFGPQECGGYDAREALNENLTKYGSNFKQYEINNNDCFSENPLTTACKVKWNVFLYDGAHDSQATQKAIELYGKACNNPFILVVDDWQLTDEVKIGTIEALKSFKEFPKTWTCEKSNGYHEGLFIAVLEQK